MKNQSENGLTEQKLIYRKRWTEDEVNTLRELVGQRKTDAEISSIMGRKKSAVSEKRSSLGLYKPLSENPSAVFSRIRRLNKLRENK